MNPETLILKKEEVGKIAGTLSGVGIFILLTSLGAWVKIWLPFTPVPITLQTFFVLLGGACLGKKGAPLTQGMYILLGTLGMPLFAKGGGWLYLLGPTGGYLIGFVISSWIVASLLEKRETWLWMLFIFLLGSGIIYLLGVLWLSTLHNLEIKKAIILGVLPFIPGDTLKVLGVTSLTRWKRIKETFEFARWS